MAEVPQGMLSLTYALVYDQSLREQWMNNELDVFFKQFGISDSATQAKIREINAALGSPDEGLRNSLIDQWMALVGDDIRQGAANPLVLW